MAPLKLPATVTMDDAATVLKTVEAALKSASGALCIDASALTEIDTAAIALLLQARRLAAAQGLKFELNSAPEQLVALTRLYGVESLLETSA